MAHPVPSTEPAQIHAGDTATWLKSLPDYPASDGWVLSYALVKTGTRITFSAAASGADHLVSVPASTTASWAVGDYQWSAKVTKGAEIHTVATGAMEIVADYAAAGSGLDARSHARKTLDALEAWIEGRDMGVAGYEIAGRSLRAIPIPELLVLRDRYRRYVRTEEDAQRAAAGLPARGKLLVRFGKP